MAKSRTGLTHKSIFGVFAIFLSLVGLVAVSAAAQQRTSTQSEASREFSCSRDPELKLIKKPEGRKVSVKYYISIRNRDNHDSKKRDNCLRDDYVLRVEKPEGWSVGYINAPNNSNYIQINEGDTKEFELIITRPINTKKGNYKIKVNAANNRHETLNADETLILNYNVE